MTERKIDLDRIRIAAPCFVPWDAMTGDARVRHCDACRMNVYNIAELTRPEAETLIAGHEGRRLCLRLFKRADGTVITKDCPVGLRAYRKKIARLAGAALTMILGLFSASYGQKDDKKAIDASKLEITRTVREQSVLSGTICDWQGAVLPGAEITLYKGKIPIIKTVSDITGEFTFSALTPDIYSLEAKAQGFKTYKVKNIRINDREQSRLNINLIVDGEVLIGIYAGNEPSIDVTSSGAKTVITREMIEKLPH
ncbi:MAG: carboxypeptidase regulatory-like domain-containing protein [Acidobacteria bacterium]|nr:carboxypeptidase regulatory-like domain-containing protein [Acidobacteriota bacterium]